MKKSHDCFAEHRRHAKVAVYATAPDGRIYCVRCLFQERKMLHQKIARLTDAMERRVPKLEERVTRLSKKPRR